jgi:rod shape-determining protein MreD
MGPIRIDERMELSDRTGTLMSGRFLSALVPFLCGVLAVLFSNLPLSFTNGLVPAPLLALVPIYFWCLVRPDLMPPGAVFGIGLFQDIMAGGPPGVWTLSFVVTYAVIERQREAFAGLSGLGAVLGFATAALIASACAYATVALYYWHSPPIAPIVAELVVTVLFYIPGVYVVGVVHRRLVGPLRSDF